MSKFKLDINVFNESFKDLVDQGNELHTKTIEPAIKSAEDVRRKVSPLVVDTSSIIARAKNSVLQFPVYITTSGIRANEAHLISKLLERVYASYVQNVLSMHKFQSQEDLNNLAFLKNFHTNIQESTSIYENKYYSPIDDMDAIIGESIVNTIPISEDVSIEFRATPMVNKDLIMENARLMNVPLTGLTYIQEDTETPKISNKKETSNKGSIPERVLTREALQKILDFNNKTAAAKGKPTVNLNDFMKAIRDNPNGVSFVTDRNERRNIYYRRSKTGEKDPATGELVYEDLYYIPAVDIKTEILDAPRDQIIKAPEMLNNHDIKKINGMLPYGIRVTFRIKDFANAADVEYLIGIKTVLHPVAIKDLADDIENIISGELKNLRKIKYKTGELSFKDYWFNLSGLKADAAKRLKSGKRWIASLKQLAEYHKVHGSILKRPAGLTRGDKGIPIPNGTLVISKSEVDSIRDSSGVDLEEVSTAQRLSKALFLICIMIVDGSAGTMRVLMTGDSNWDTQAISQLDSEIAKMDNSSAVKELGKLIYTPRR